MHMRIRKPHTRWLATLAVGALTTGLAVTLPTVVGRGQNVQSGQSFTEPLPPAPVMPPPTWP